MTGHLLTNVHDVPSLEFNENCYLVRGAYNYHHYVCDGFDDRVNNSVFANLIKFGIKLERKLLLIIS